MKISGEQYNKLPERLREHFYKGNFHCTTKPLKLMEYLCTLTKTPTGGVVLDPFAGSGTTGVACQNTGRDFILIEMTPEYIPIIEARTGVKCGDDDIDYLKRDDEALKELDKINEVKILNKCPECGGKIKGKYCEDCLEEIGK